MKYEKISLSDTDSNVYLETYAGDILHGKLRDAILVIPGGGYVGVCSDREGEPIALAFLSRGVQAFVLHYSVGQNAAFPTPLIEASKAMAYIRQNAAIYGVDPDRIFACGFSAGGHLCASLGSMWYYPEVYTGANIPYGTNKPAGVIPVYAVTSYETQGHGDCTFGHVFGTDDPSEEQIQHWSPVHAIGPNSVPHYLVHTSADQVVPVDNCLLMGRALAKNKIPFELHIFQDGPHGIALANEVTDCNNPQWINPSAAMWVEGAYRWMKNS